MNPDDRDALIQSYTVFVTETHHTSVVFDTKEEAEEWMKEPDYDLCRIWDIDDSNFRLVENVPL